MSRLVRPHGSDVLKPLLLEGAALAAERRRAESLPKVHISSRETGDLIMLGIGGFTPLEGFMTRADWEGVCDGMKLANGLFWPIPITLSTDRHTADGIKTGGEVALVDRESGETMATMRVTEKYSIDKEHECAMVFKTTDRAHPGVKMVTEQGDVNLAGPVKVLSQGRFPLDFANIYMTPAETRRLFEAKGWSTVVAFQTRNPLHRAHEYALVAGAERLTREGHFTGIVLNPLVGELKGDDVPAVVRMRAYRKLHDDRLLGEGDKDEALWRKVGYDLSEVFELIGLDMKMFYGGPSEAVMHAIYRQNFGMSDLVIGRKHADAPFEDGKPIWGDFDAQQAFDELGGELHVRPCKIGFAAFYESLGRVDLTDNHPDEKPVVVSGTRVREQLQRGQRPDPRIMRPQIADVLIESYRG